MRNLTPPLRRRPFAREPCLTKEYRSIFVRITGYVRCASQEQRLLPEQTSSPSLKAFFLLQLPPSSRFYHHSRQFSQFGSLRSGNHISSNHNRWVRSASHPERSAGTVA